MKKLEKVQVSILPTPLHKLENISNDLKDYNIYIKRDDMTGFGIGGNKLRKLDYIVKKAIDEGCDTLLTYGGPQTNHGRLTAAAAAKFGMKSIIMCYGKPPERISGNLLLDRIIGTEVFFMDTDEVKRNSTGKTHEEITNLYRNLKMSATRTVVKRYKEQGNKVAIIQIGGHSKEGLMGYFDCVEEIEQQSKDMNVKFDYIVLGNGSGGTLGGLLLGKKYYESTFQIYASNISEIPEKQITSLLAFCNKTSKEFEMGVEVSRDDFVYSNKYIGIGYNIPDKETRDVISYVASKEGIFIDPCYTGKSFKGLLGFIKEGCFKKNSNILFIHTGGTPGLWTEEHEDAFNQELWNDIEVF